MGACVPCKIIRIGCNVRLLIGSNSLKTVDCSFYCGKAVVILFYSDMVILMRSFLFQLPGERDILRPVTEIEMEDSISRECRLEKELLG